MNVKQSVVKKLESAYVKCIKMFFNFHKCQRYVARISVT